MVPLPVIQTLVKAGGRYKLLKGPSLMDFENIGVGPVIGPIMVIGDMA